MNNNTVAYAGNLPGTAICVNSAAEAEFKDSKGNLAEFTIPAGKLTDRRFRIIAKGKAVGAVATNLTVILHAGAALGTNLFTTGAVATKADGTASWLVIWEGTVDAVLHQLTGLGRGIIYQTAVAEAAAFAASQDPDTALTFSISGTLSAANAGNSATLDEFSLEVL